ncbi:hypothetical protein LPTSP3_g31270 [Leptospira kobayashii]|uniref:Shedu protein SduA C-terminal domain-containing protein n=1 Tax=Leptospira kobayashii TaxID=1917830 RepID=A0ABM7UMB1_9LEPT|nr:Shedu immune nuclease family protein [Leptospira kobayashii]BDA80197.1 hypothetical protein LPTSP3_g31270 [Leptospira kobayashii]
MPINIRKEKNGKISNYYWNNDELFSNKEIRIFEINRSENYIRFYPPDFYNWNSKKFEVVIEFIGMSKLPYEIHEKGYIKSGGSYYLFKFITEENINRVIINQDEPFTTKVVKQTLYLKYSEFSKFIKDLQTAINESKREKVFTFKSLQHSILPSKYPEGDFSNSIKEKRLIESLDENIISDISPENLDKIENFYLSLLEKKYKQKDKKTNFLLNNYTAVKSKVITNAILIFKSLIEENATESKLGKFLMENLYIIDSKYIKSIPEINVMLGGNRRFDFGLIDFDYNLDIFEIKRPQTKLLASETDHGNYYFHPELVKSVVQAEKYLYNAESKKSNIENDIKRELELDFHISLVRPNAYLIIGHSNQLNNDNKKEDFKVLRKSYKNIQIILYDEILNRLLNLEKKLK